MDLVAQDQRTDSFQKMNPQGLVPALEIDGLLLTQSLAIIDYLDETRPEAPLLPHSAEGRAKVRAIAHAIAMEIHPINNLSVLQHVEIVSGGVADAKLEWMHHFMPPALAAINNMLERSAASIFCYGEKPTVADVCLVPQLYNAQRWGIDLKKFDHISRVLTACNLLPAFIAAHPDMNK